MAHLYLIYLVKVAMYHSYVSLPKAMSKTLANLTAVEFPATFSRPHTCTDWLLNSSEYLLYGTDRWNTKHFQLFYIDSSKDSTKEWIPSGDSQTYLYQARHLMGDVFNYLRLTSWKTCSVKNNAWWSDKYTYTISAPAFFHLWASVSLKMVVS